jgi:hypothetical protein
VIDLIFEGEYQQLTLNLFFYKTFEVTTFRLIYKYRREGPGPYRTDYHKCGVDFRLIFRLFLLSLLQIIPIMYVVCN